MISLSHLKGGGLQALHLLLFVIVLIGDGTLCRADTTYHGLIDYFDSAPNEFLTMDQEGNLSIVNTFTEGTWERWIDPRGIIMIGRDPDSAADDFIRWYRIEGETFVKSPHDIHIPFDYPILWTETPFRAIIGNYPIQVWQFDPVSLNCWMLSEYYDEDARGGRGTFVKDLNMIFYDPSARSELRRIYYNPLTFEISGPVTIFPTIYSGSHDHVSTLDGRYIVALDNSFVMIHRIDDEGIPHTISYDHPFGMRNLYKARFLPNDRYVIIIANDDNTVNSFELLTDGSLAPVTQWAGFDLAQALAVTHDGKYLIVSHHYYAGYPRAILSVFSIGTDGSIVWLPDKDIYLNDMPRRLQFFPPPQWPTSANPTWEIYE
jgi:hypothetical protein